MHSDPLGTPFRPCRGWVGRPLTLLVYDTDSLLYEDRETLYRLNCFPANESPLCSSPRHTCRPDRRLLRKRNFPFLVSRRTDRRPDQHLTPPPLPPTSDSATWTPVLPQFNLGLGPGSDMYRTSEHLPFRQTSSRVDRETETQVGVVYRRTATSWVRLPGSRPYS